MTIKDEILKEEFGLNNKQIKDIIENENTLGNPDIIPIIDLTIQKVIDIIEKLKENYPLDIFSKPNKAQYKLLHIHLEKYGLTLDQFSADIFRRQIDNIVKELKGEL